VARAGGALFAILAAHTISEVARDAIFLRSSTPENLAVAYGALAGIAVLALIANTALVKRLGRRYALIATLMAAAFGTVLFYEAHPSGAVAFALYMWTGLLGTLVVVQYWMLAATVFTSSEAKRLYGLIAALGALGALFGALAARVLLIGLHTEQLLPLAAALYCVAGVTLSTDDSPAQPTLNESADAGFRVRLRPAGPVRLRDHPYALRLALLLVLATAAAMVADYLLKTSAYDRYHGARDIRLSTFFATYNGVVSAVSLVFQVFGASWLLRKGGVLGAIVMLPLLMLLGGVATVLTAGAFIAAVATKGADATLRHSVNRVANELLWMPVSDTVRTAVREPLESVVVRLVQAGTAAALFGITAAGFASKTVLAAITIGISTVWVGAAIGLRPKYLAQLRSSLSKPTFTPESELDLGSLEVVVEALSSTDDRRVIAAIQVLAAHQRGRLIPALVLRHDSPEVLTVALDAIAHTGRTDWLPLTKRLQTSPDPRVRIAALRALARTGMRDAIQVALSDADPSVRAAGVFWLYHADALDNIAAQPEVAAMLALTGDDSSVARRQLLESIRQDGDARWTDVLASLARVGDSTTIENVALAIERVPDVRFVPILIGRLGTRAGRGSVRAALVAIGDPALTALEDALKLFITPPRIRMHLPTTIALFGSKRAADVLIAQLAAERSGAVRYRLLRALARLAVSRTLRFDQDLLLDELRHHLREHFRLLGLSVPLMEDASAAEAILTTGPLGSQSLDTRTGSTQDTSDSLRLLRGLLQDKSSQALDRVFLALQAMHPREDIRGIERALSGRDRGARAHALEFLDTVTRSPIYLRPRAAGIREDLLLVGEDLDSRERVVRAGDQSDVPANATEALARLVRDTDTLLAACAAYHALQLDREELRTMVDQVARERPLLLPLGITVQEAISGG
jgi:AAA family ATP:ADP antiporter